MDGSNNSKSNFVKLIYSKPINRFLVGSALWVIMSFSDIALDSYSSNPLTEISFYVGIFFMGLISFITLTLFYFVYKQAKD